MNALHSIDRQVARYNGYHDMNGDFVPFAMSDEVFRRARKLGARVLLRLELGDNQELQGLFYTNDRSLSR
ncbi:MAG: hypothetical protein EXR86_02190 [Gammaproteobacteria bacterium]|nr:hypothetical protein [Gammaproteobacteria bacterium]